MSTAGTDAAVARRARIVRTGSRPGGGSLIEVMIALVLLGVGMLALQTLALVAGRSVGIAERNTKSAIAAARLAESTLAKLSADSLPSAMDCPIADGGHLARAVSLSLDGTVAHFEVIVTEAVGVSGTRDLNVSGYAYSPHGFAEGGETDPCP